MISAGRGARQGQDPRQFPGLDAAPRPVPHARRTAMERDQATKFINDLLKLMVSRNGSDLFLTGDFPPAIKVDGKITKVSPQPLNAGHTLALARSIMNDKQAAEFERTKECNFAISPPAIGRFRVNAFVQQGKVGHGAAGDPAGAAHDRRPGPAAGAQGRGDVQARPRHPGRRHRLRQVDHAWRRWSTGATRTRTATSSRSRTRWSSSIRTRTAWSRSARWGWTPTAGRRR